MTITTREQHERLRLLTLASAVSKGIAEMDHKADKQRYLNYLREMADLIIMAPANTEVQFSKQPPVSLYASTVDGEQSPVALANTVDGEQLLTNPVLFQTLHPGIGGA